MTAVTPLSHFGECESCFEPVERPGWDRVCRECREAEREDDLCLCGHRKADDCPPACGYPSGWKW